MVLGGIFNAFPYTTYSQNVGLVQLTGVRNRVIIYTCGGMLIVLGFIPKIAAITTIIPKSVLGGAMLAMFGMVMAYGIKMLSSVDFGRQENLLIVACSVGIGLGVTVVPTLFSQLPESIRILTDNGIVLGSASAVLLNIVFNMVPQRKVKVKDEPVPIQSAVREDKKQGLTMRPCFSLSGIIFPYVPRRHIYQVVRIGNVTATSG